VDARSPITKGITEHEELTQRKSKTVLVESLRLLQARESLAEEIQKGFEQIDLGQCIDGPVAIAKLRDRLKTQLGS
jgi:hypothetical protein